MVDYNYWIKHVERFKLRFGNKIGIEYCDLEISDNYSKNTPEIIFGRILIPTQYLDLLNVHCNAILCNRNLFQNIGNYKDENLNQQTFEVPDFTLSPNNFKTNHLPTSICHQLPIDDRRKKIAGLLRDMITFFAIYHELGHARQDSFKNLQEISYIQSQNEKWEKQAVEIDADIFSINWLWRTIFHNFYEVKPNEPFQTRSELLELCLFSTFLFFFLSNNAEDLYAPLKSHPHPIIRFEIVSIFLKEILVTNFLPLEEFNKVITTVLNEFKKTLVYHFGSVSPVDYFKKFKSSELIKVKSILQKYMEQNISLNRKQPYCVD